MSLEEVCNLHSHFSLSWKGSNDCFLRQSHHTLKEVRFRQWNPSIENPQQNSSPSSMVVEYIRDEAGHSLGTGELIHSFRFFQLIFWLDELILIPVHEKGLTHLGKIILNEDWWKRKKVPYSYTRNNWQSLSFKFHLFVLLQASACHVVPQNNHGDETSSG